MALRAALFIGALTEGVLATAVKAMGADLTLGQADGLDHLLDAVEPQRGKSQLLGDGIYHAASPWWHTS